MDWSAGVVALIAAAFGLGALHALEPGHGKSIMGAYLIASRGAMRHALLLGLVVTLTHTFVVFLLAAAALYWAEGKSDSHATFWLQVISGSLVIAVGIWMVLSSFKIVGHHARHSHGPAPKHEHEHPHPHDHDHAHPDDHHPPHEHPHPEGEGHGHGLKIPEGKNPLSFWTLVTVGTSGGLVPCPAALTALFAAVNLGRTIEGIAIVAAMSLGIAATLIAVGILFVKARDWASRRFDAGGFLSTLPRISAVFIVLLGTVLVVRAFFGHEH
jgi:nickel/cobalt exporter